MCGSAFLVSQLFWHGGGCFSARRTFLLQTNAFPLLFPLAPFVKFFSSAPTSSSRPIKFLLFLNFSTTHHGETQRHANPHAERGARGHLQALGYEACIQQGRHEEPIVEDQAIAMQTIRSLCQTSRQLLTLGLMPNLQHIVVVVLESSYRPAHWLAPADCRWRFPKLLALELIGFEHSPWVTSRLPAPKAGSSPLLSTLSVREAYIYQL